MRRTLQTTNNLAAFLILASCQMAGAETFKTTQACVDDIDSVVTRVDGMFERGEEPSERDKSIYLMESSLRTLCRVGFLSDILLAPNWPKGESPWSTIEAREMLRDIQLKVEKALPGVPVFISRSEAPESFRREWMRDFQTRNGHQAEGAILSCTSEVGGKATGQSIESAIRAHLLKCRVKKVEMEFLGLVEDHNFREQFNQHAEFVVNQFVRYWRLAKKY